MQSSEYSFRRAIFKTSVWFAMSQAIAGANVVNVASSFVSTMMVRPSPKQTTILLAIRQIVTISKTSPRAPGCYR